MKAPAASSPISENNLETDQREDMLLMGTEVTTSCQNKEGALRRAKDLNITLVASRKDYTETTDLNLYPNPLKALGGPVPF